MLYEYRQLRVGCEYDHWSSRLASALGTSDVGAHALPIDTPVSRGGD
jgi:hypothetical protein